MGKNTLSLVCIDVQLLLLEFWRRQRNGQAEWSYSVLEMVVSYCESQEFPVSGAYGNMDISILEVEGRKTSHPWALFFQLRSQSRQALAFGLLQWVHFCGIRASLRQ